MISEIPVGKKDFTVVFGHDLIADAASEYQLGSIDDTLFKCIMLYSIARSLMWPNGVHEYLGMLEDRMSYSLIVVHIVISQSKWPQQSRSHN